MRILFVCRTFDNVIGGVQSMSALLMNEMVKRGHDIGLITWDRIDAQSYYAFSNNINWMKISLGDVNKPATWKLRFQRHKLMRKFIKNFKPNVIIGYQNGAFLSAKVSSLLLNIPVIAAERNSPDRFRYLKAGKYQNLIYRSFMFATRITVQFDNYKDMYPKYLRKKIIAIHNPIIMNDSYIYDEKKLKYNILHVGRLSFQKNQEFLINSFFIVSNHYPDWNLTIVGDGEYKKKCKALVKKLNIENKVHFTGPQRDVSKYYKNAQIFALPSKWEGFPNALGEALSYGIPSIGLRSTNGVNELITDGKNGLLTENSEEEFAKGLIQLIKNRNLRIKMSHNAKQMVQEYEPKKIFDKWEKLFRTICE